MPDQKTLDVYAAKADDYVSCVKGEGGRNIRQFIERLKPGGTVLDIGCGPGQASAQLAKAGMQVTAIDPVPEMIAFAKQNPGVDARVGTFDDIDGDEIYDGVWANFCLLHADRKDIPRHIAAIARALKPEGVFHIGMKTGTGAHRDDIGRLYTYVQVEELTEWLKDVGLTPVDTWEGAEKGLAGTIDAWVQIRATKNG